MVLIEQFCNVYGITIDNVHQQIHRGTIKEPVVKKIYKEGSTKASRIYIDQLYFERRKEFRKKIWLHNHEMFFFLTKHISQSDLCRVMSKMSSFRKDDWEQWFSRYLFMTDDGSILDNNITNKQWLFYRVGRWIIAKLFIVAKVKVRDINILLDNDIVTYKMNWNYNRNYKGAIKYFKKQTGRDTFQERIDYYEDRRLLTAG